MQNMNYYEKDYEDDYAFAVSTKWKEEKSRKRYEVYSSENGCGFRCKC